jgi:hypothetical protein
MLHLQPLVGGVNACGQAYQANGTLADAPSQRAWVEEAMRANAVKEKTPDAHNADENQNALGEDAANAVK